MASDFLGKICFNSKTNMDIPPKIQPFIYGIGVFIVFTALMTVMKLTTNRLPESPDYFGLFSKKDFLIGGGVAVILTLMHERKKRL